MNKLCLLWIDSFGTLNNVSMLFQFTEHIMLAKGWGQGSKWPQLSGVTGMQYAIYIIGEYTACLFGTHVAATCDTIELTASIVLAAFPANVFMMPI